MLIQYLVASSVILLFSCSLAFGELKINSFNNFNTVVNFQPMINQKSLAVLAFEWANIFLDEEGKLANFTSLLNGGESEITNPPLVYPNPFRLEEGADLGYGLKRMDMDIQIRIYDMRGYEICRKNIEGGTEGAMMGYNRLRLNRAFFGHGTLPAGVYFYVFVMNNELLGKGKFVIEP